MPMGKTHQKKVLNGWVSLMYMDITKMFNELSKIKCNISMTFIKVI